jgi:hypothetical protein
MAFQEKSAWVMSVSLLLGGLFYFGVVKTMTAEIGQLAPPILPTVMLYTIILIVVAIIGHIAIAVLTPKEANAPLDEREKTIFHRASHVSGYLFGAGVLLSLGVYLYSYSGDALFYGVFASLMISQLAEYIIRILFYRVFV